MVNGVTGNCDTRRPPKCNADRSTPPGSLPILPRTVSEAPRPHEQIRMEYKPCPWPRWFRYGAMKEACRVWHETAMGIESVAVNNWTLRTAGESLRIRIEARYRRLGEPRVGHLPTRKSFSSMAFRRWVTATSLLPTIVPPVGSRLPQSRPPFLGTRSVCRPQSASFIA